VFFLHDRNRILIALLILAPSGDGGLFEVAVHHGYELGGVPGVTRALFEIELEKGEVNDAKGLVAAEAARTDVVHGVTVEKVVLHRVGLAIQMFFQTHYLLLEVRLLALALLQEIVLVFVNLLQSCSLLPKLKFFLQTCFSTMLAGFSLCKLARLRTLDLVFRSWFLPNFTRNSNSSSKNSLLSFCFI